MLIHKHLPHKSFEAKVDEAIFLAWDTSTIQGAFVSVMRGKKITVVAASVPIPWPLNVNERNQKWSVLERPNSSIRVWAGSLVGLIWDAGPERMKNELVTFEERTCPKVPGDMLQDNINKLSTGLEKDLQQFVHGIIAELPHDAVGDQVPNEHGHEEPQPDSGDEPNEPENQTVLELAPAASNSDVKPGTRILLHGLKRCSI